MILCLPYYSSKYFKKIHTPVLTISDNLLCWKKTTFLLSHKQFRLSKTTKTIDIYTNLKVLHHQHRTEAVAAVAVTVSNVGVQHTSITVVVATATT